MRLNHLDLLVRDVPGSVAYFQRYFGLTPRTRSDAPSFAILSDGEGFVLVLQHAEAPVYPDGFHLGFLVDDVHSVRTLQERGRADGAEVSDVIVNGRGTMIYFQAPDGYRVEVSCQHVRWD
jgi:catechol 2,3-dioxygenase-like lactoylglutathione lyase family enzyme